MRLREGRSAAWVALFLVALTQAAYIAVRGTVFANDSITYSRWADILIRDGFRYDRYVQDVASTYPVGLYVGWVTVVAQCKLLFGAHWQSAVVTINVIAASLTGAMIAGLAQRVTQSFRVGVAAAVICCCAFDLFNWNRYVLSDATFVPLAFGAFAVLGFGLLGEGHALRAIVASILISGVAVFYRPTGVAMLPVLGVSWLVVAMRERAVLEVDRRPHLIAAGVVCLGIVIGIGFVVFARIMEHPETWPIRPGLGDIQYTAERFRDGEVVWDRHDTFHSPPGDYLDYLSLVFDRFAHFFYFSNVAFSRAHKFGSTFFYLAVYALDIRALFFAASARSGLDGARRLVIALSAALIIVTAAFHGMVQVDYDWRYRTPVMPHFILLAAIGLSPQLVQVGLLRGSARTALRGLRASAARSEGGTSRSR